LIDTCTSADGADVVVGVAAVGAVTGVIGMSEAAEPGFETRAGKEIIAMRSNAIALGSVFIVVPLLISCSILADLL
jgi:hypothetical protein